MSKENINNEETDKIDEDAFEVPSSLTVLDQGFYDGIRIPKMLKVDPEKIQGLHDVRLIFEAIDIRFSEDHIMFDKIKHLLEEDGD